jgi:UDP-N-acetylmuramoylalanine-D-glutamate ligase
LAYEIVEKTLSDLGISYTADDIHHAIETIKPLKHRMQICKKSDSITWYDDGKSTSAQSLSAALQSFHQPLVVICG